MPPYEKCFKIDKEGNVFPTDRPSTCKEVIKVAPWFEVDPKISLWIMFDSYGQKVCLDSRTIEQLARLIPRMKKMKWPNGGTEL